MSETSKSLRAERPEFVPDNPDLPPCVECEALRKPKAVTPEGDLGIELEIFGEVQIRLPR